MADNENHELRRFQEELKSQMTPKARYQQAGRRIASFWMNKAIADAKDDGDMTDKMLQIQAACLYVLATVAYNHERQSKEDPEIIFNSFFELMCEELDFIKSDPADIELCNPGENRAPT